MGISRLRKLRYCLYSAYLHSSLWRQNFWLGRHIKWGPSPTSKVEGPDPLTLPHLCLCLTCTTTTTTTTTTTLLLPLDFVWDNPGEPVPEETFTHSPEIHTNQNQIDTYETVYQLFDTGLVATPLKSTEITGLVSAWSCPRMVLSPDGLVSPFYILLQSPLCASIIYYNPFHGILSVQFTCLTVFFHYPSFFSVCLLACKLWN